VASLWKVDDEATAALVARFYEHRRGGASVSEALSAAQADIREDPDWSDPRYWAAWVLWGLP
jgi:CHAT domain-containing protein